MVDVVVDDEAPTVVAWGEANPGVTAPSLGVLTGDGAFGAGVSTAPNKDFAAGVLEVADASFVVSVVVDAPPKLNPPIAGAGVAEASFFSSVVVVVPAVDVAPPKENPPAAAGGLIASVFVSDGAATFAPPKLKPPPDGAATFDSSADLGAPNDIPPVDFRCVAY